MNDDDETPNLPARVSRKLTEENVTQMVDQAHADPASEYEEAADPFYEPYFCQTIVLLAEQMWFPEQWASEMGVTERRMMNWVIRYPEFADAYETAITKLRAEFTADFVRTARGGKEGAVGPMYILLAKKRFPDLFGDVPTAPPSAAAPPKDITPNSAEIIEHAPIEGSEADKLRAELEELRKIHGQT